MTYCELPDGLYVARDGKLWKMDTRYIPPKDAKVCWIGRKPSNADRIRAMTDEELSYLIVDNVDCNSRCKAWKEGCEYSDSTCRQAWLEWLKKECET